MQHKLSLVISLSRLWEPDESVWRLLVLRGPLRDVGKNYPPRYSRLAALYVAVSLDSIARSWIIRRKRYINKVVCLDVLC